MAKIKSVHKIKRKHYIYKLNMVLFIILISELCFATANYFLHNKEFVNTVALATTIKPEIFTELYFEDNSNLPSTIETNKTVSFKFTVHNLEDQTFTYPYEVYILENGKKIDIDKGHFILSNNDYKTISEIYTPVIVISDAQIVVDLPNKNQEIFFWVNKEGSNEN